MLDKLKWPTTLPISDKTSSSDSTEVEQGPPMNINSWKARVGSQCEYGYADPPPPSTGLDLRNMLTTHSVTFRGTYHKNETVLDEETMMRIRK